MSPASVRRLAWGAALLALVIMVSATVLRMTTGSGDDSGWPGFMWSIATVFTVTGHLIATRRPENAIGWLFLLAGVSATVATLARAHVEHWLTSGYGPDGLGEAAAVYGDLSWIPFILVPTTFLLLLFPDGHLLTPRWRAVAWSAGLAIPGVFVAGVLKPGPLEDFPSIINPFGVDNLVREIFDGVAFLLLFIGLFGSAISLIVRFRRAVGEQRQQMKWLALAGAIAVITIPLVFATYEVLPDGAGDRAIMVSVLGLPAATAVAMLRYRLYDIDLVINRALVYGSLTATLAGVYIGSVLLLQGLLSGLTEGSGLAVAASTLAVAALFRPFRSRIQESVDRRFFRSRYDATQTLESFSARLRHEVDLAAISQDLQAVAAATMQPVHVSLWLRSQEPS